jgi:protein-tyrosine phosphatase
MIDIHTHLLPGVDDGAADVTESVEMALLSAAKGVRGMVATPHIREDYAVPIRELAGRVDDLNAALRARGVELMVHRGGEVAVTKVEQLDDEMLRAVSLGGGSRYVLLETPYGGVPSSFEDAVFRLALRGFTAVVAHPERSPSFQARPERIGGLVERGALVQVTAGALLAGFGRSARAFAYRLLRDGWAHALASDVHHAGGSGSSLAAARHALAAEGLPEVARWATEDVPAALLADLPPPPPPALQAERRGRRWWWRRRP